MIRRKKRQCWNQFVCPNGHRDLWDVVRIAKDPLHLQGIMSSLTGQGNTFTSQEEIVSALRRHYQVSNPVSSEISPIILSSPLPFRPAKASSLTAVYKTLSWTANTSTPGPDGIHYRLLKLIKDTQLERAILSDIGCPCDAKGCHPPGRTSALHYCDPQTRKRPFSPKIMETNSAQQHSGQTRGKMCRGPPPGSPSWARRTPSGLQSNAPGQDLVSAFNTLRRRPILDISSSLDQRTE